MPVQQALRHLQTAFVNFFAKRARYPQFRRKDGPQSVEYTASAFRRDDTSLKLAKVDAPLAIRWSRQLPKAARITTVTVSRDAAGRYFVSLLCDDAVEPLPAVQGQVQGQVGIDLGLTKKPGAQGTRLDIPSSSPDAIGVGIRRADYMRPKVKSTSAVALESTLAHCAEAVAMFSVPPSGFTSVPATEMEVVRLSLVTTTSTQSSPRTG